MPIFTYAANENTVVVKQEDNSHIIYVKGYLDKKNFNLHFQTTKMVTSADAEFENLQKTQ